MPGMYAFDTLAFAKKLQKAGYTEPQAEALAEAQSEVFREMLESTLATKEDLRALEGAIRADISRLETTTKADVQRLEGHIHEVREELKRDIQDVRKELKGDIRDLRKDLDSLGLKLTIRLGAVVVASMGAMGVLFRIFLFPGG